MSMPTYLRARILRGRLLALLAAAPLACSSLTPADTRYRPGRFEFDWPTQAATPGSDLQRSVDQRLERDTELLVIKLQDAAIIGAVRRANVLRSRSDGSAIMGIEERWRRAGPDDPFVSSRIDSACSESLRLLNERSADFMEILVTDDRGHVVCQTRMTDRYYWGDERWWRECVEAGRLSHSRLEYDEVEKRIDIAIFAPVVDSATGEAIGVSRALLRRRISP